MKHWRWLVGLLLLMMAGCADAELDPAQARPSQGVAGVSALAAGPQTVQGKILGGGDTTPPGLMDAPRTYIYQVELEDGQTISVAFTSYPPSPAFASGPPYRLTVHTAEIQPGNYLIAHGSYDPQTQTLSVAVEGDFFEVYAEKP